MNKDIGHIVAVKRNPIYSEFDFRRECAMQVVRDFHKFIPYDNDGIAEFVFPWKKDCDHSFYCSELINYYCIKHSDGEINLRGDNSKEDDITPYAIQVSPHLKDVPLLGEVYQLNEMDYVLTTSKNTISGLIRAKSAGLDDLRNQEIASHCGIVIHLDGRFWIAEMLRDGSAISSIHKYQVR